MNRRRPLPVPCSKSPRPPYLLALASLATTFILLTGTAQAGGRNVVAWYSLDDGTAVDGSGNGNDGQILGTATGEPGISGQALRFEGTGFIGVRPSDDLSSDLLSVSIWVRIDQPSNRVLPLLSKVSAATGYTLAVLADGSLNFEVRSAAQAVSVRTPFPLFPGVWTSVYAAYDGQEARLSVDGQLVDRRPAAGMLIANDTHLLIGAGRVPQGPWLSGVIDEIKIADSAGTAEDACDEALKVWDAVSGTCLPAFVDIAPELGVADVDHRHLGTTLVDIDQDGWLDLYYVNGLTNPDIDPVPSGTCPDLTEIPPFEPESVNVLFMNQGDGTFGPDSAAAVGIDDFWNAMRHVWGDIENDGQLDLVSHNFVLSSLYRAVPGPDLLFQRDPNFELCLNHGTGAAFADLDGDRLLDIYAGEYDPSRPAEDDVNRLLMGEPNGLFTDVLAASGLDLPNNPMGVAFSDFDRDGDQDLFLTNSHEAPSRLFRHDGLDPLTGIPQFTDIAPEAGVAVVGDPSRGVGAAFGDFNNDGLPDLLYSREEDSRLWRNDGPDEGGVWRFTDVTGQGGLDLALPGLFFWGGNFVDLDLDGWLDIVLTNRALDGDGSDTANRVFFNNGDGTWREVAAVLGLQVPDDHSTGVVPGDIDNDGDLDLVIISHDLGEPNHVFRNDMHGHNWIQFRLHSTVSNRDAIGARIEVSAILPGHGLVTQMREVVAGSGFFSDIPRVQTFGLGKAATIESIVITWPSGQVQELGPMAVNRRHDVDEPEAGSLANTPRR